jgi:hypothetical protein
MKYMLLIYLDENALSEDERQKCYVESIELTHNSALMENILAPIRFTQRRRRQVCVCATADV